MNDAIQSPAAAAQSTPKPNLRFKKRKGPWLVASATGKLDIPECTKGQRLSEGKNPRLIHYSLEHAAKEAERLGGMFPEQQFAIFECIGNVEVVK